MNNVLSDKNELIKAKDWSNTMKVWRVSKEFLILEYILQILAYLEYDSCLDCN